VPLCDDPAVPQSQATPCLAPPRALVTLRYVLFGCRFSVQSEVIVFAGTYRVPHRRRRVTHHARLPVRYVYGRHEEEDSPITCNAVSFARVLKS